LKESSDCETLMAVGIWFQIWGAAEEKARCPKLVFTPGTGRRDWLEERNERLGLYVVIQVSRLLSGEDPIVR